MGRDPNQNQTPDLFSTGAELSANRPSEGVSGQPSRRSVLPKGLPKAIQYLSDGELDWLLRTAIEEAERRGRLVPMGMERPTNMPTVLPEPAPKQTKPPRQANPSEANRSCADTVDTRPSERCSAAFKAGVTPTRIARQFGLTSSQVRKALCPMNQSDDALSQTSGQTQAAHSGSEGL